MTIEWKYKHQDLIAPRNIHIWRKISIWRQTDSDTPIILIIAEAWDWFQFIGRITLYKADRISAQTNCYALLTPMLDIAAKHFHLNFSRFISNHFLALNRLSEISRGGPPCSHYYNLIPNLHLLPLFLPDLILSDFDNSLSGLFWWTLCAVRRSPFINSWIIYLPCGDMLQRFAELPISRSVVIATWMLQRFV
jgi:hypothetical protein